MKINRKLTVITVCVFVLGLLLMMPVIAEPMHGGKAAHHVGSAVEAKKGHKSKKSKGHLFSAHWAKTLDDQQKLDIDKMHLELAKQQSGYKAELKLREAELNLLIIEDKTNLKNVKAKISQIVTLKERIMLARFVHIAEMRARLNDQQRISYDMGVMKRNPKKH